MEERENFVVDGICPLSELPCPNGKKAASECRLQVYSGFDPIASFSDLCTLECAKEQAEKKRNQTAANC